MLPTKNSLSENVRQKVIKILQERLADSVDLMQQLKQAHWNVKGPNFIGLHQLFDQIHEKTEECTDLLAERIAQLGGLPEGTCHAVSQSTSLPEYPLTSTEESDHIEALTTAMAMFGKLMRDAIEKVAALGDPGSADIFTRIALNADKSLWLIESHSPTSRVLVTKIHRSTTQTAHQ
jgi:starvation-inducible DNA-binding protein